MASSTVLVYEYFTAGGFPSKDVPEGLAAEALGMLWALLSDFSRWGKVRTVAALDPRFEDRIPGLNRNTLPADEIVCAPQNNYPEFYRSLLKRCDAALIIAPETDGILAALAAQAEAAGILLLGSNASAITIAGNKESCHKVFRAAKLPTPGTRSATFADALQAARQMIRPLVIKPVDGVSCEGVCRVDKLSDLAENLKTVRSATSHERILLQSFVAGTPVSVSLLACMHRCLPLSLNLQLIEAGSPFRYLGSQVPFHHPAGCCALELACSAVNLIPGLQGYVGVDLVLTEDAAQLIEINPRLTTSYIGLRQVSSVNVAQAIWEACIRGIMPDRISFAGQVLIRTDDISSWGMSEK
jgi:tyramine---L-glutamate ligase